MDISGRFIRVSSFEIGGAVLVAFCGNVYPHDLTPDQIEYIKAFYNMSGCNQEFLNTWPEEITAAHPAFKKNYQNGYLLLSYPAGKAEKTDWREEQNKND
jgi:hypothetical protein